MQEITFFPDDYQLGQTSTDDNNITLNINFEVSFPNLLRLISNTESSTNIDSNTVNQIPHKKKRIFFTAQDDQQLKSLVSKYGSKNWTLISSLMDNKSPRQCRDRYFNYLFPGYSMSEWSKEEDDLLTELYLEHGSKWSFISSYLNGRTPGGVKNRWNNFLSKRVMSLDDKNKTQKEEILQIENESSSADDLLKQIDFSVLNDEFIL